MGEIAKACDYVHKLQGIHCLHVSQAPKSTFCRRLAHNLRQSAFTISDVASRTSSSAKVAAKHACRADHKLPPLQPPQGNSAFINAKSSLAAHTPGVHLGKEVSDLLLVHVRRGPARHRRHTEDGHPPSAPDRQRCSQRAMAKNKFDNSAACIYNALLAALEKNTYTERYRARVARVCAATSLQQGVWSVPAPYGQRKWRYCTCCDCFHSHGGNFKTPDGISSPLVV